MTILRYTLVCFFLLTCFCAAAQPAGNDSTSTDTMLLPQPQPVAAATDTSEAKVFIASVGIFGNKKTKTNILEREIPFKQGDYVLKKDLQKYMDLARRQLINTSLFIDAQVFIENQTTDFVFIAVVVKERWYIFPLPYFKLADRNFNTWWVTYNRSLSRVNYGVKFLHNNISGHNDKMTVWLITGYSRQLAFKYERPYFDRTLRHGFNVAINFSQQKEINVRTDSSVQKFLKTEDAFIKQSFRVSADYVYRPAIKTKHIIRLAYENDRIADTVVSPITGNPNYFTGGKTQIDYPEISYGIQYLNSDYNAYPTRGFQIEATLMHKGINREMNLTQLQVTSSYTVPVGWKTHVQFTGGAILKVPFNQPFFNKQLFGYGGIFLQGLEYYVVDGVAGGVGRVTAARQLLALKLKTPESSKKKVEVPISFYGKVFTNAGYGYNNTPGNSLLNNRMLHTWGFGMDIVIIYDIVLKFDYSFNQFGENGLFFHVRKDF